MQLLWKEWRQQKQLFLLGCLAGISFPVFELLVYYKVSHEFGSTGLGNGIVGVFGAFFAVLLAVATTNADIKKGVDDFWQSKPVKTWKLFAVKFLVGAVILAVSFIFVMSIDFTTSFLIRNRSAYPAWRIFCCTYPRALMLFTVTMFFCVLLRDSAKAVLLAIWAGLFVYFLPILVGWLNWFNVFEQLESSRNLSELQYLPFLAVCMAIAILCIALSVVAFEHKWRWQPGQKTIAWTIGISAAFIYGVAMLQAGHNLGIVRSHNNREIIPKISLWEKSENKYNWTGETIGDDEIHRRASGQTATCVKEDLMFRISTGSQMNKELFTAVSKNTDPDAPRLDWKTPLKQHLFLDIYRFPYTKEAFHLSETRFFVTNPIARNYPQFIFGSFVRNDRLYVAYRPQSPEQQKDRRIYENPLHFLTVDVSNPNEPQRISDTEISQPKSWNGTMTNYNEHCYINDGDQLLILSVADRDKPEIVGQVDLSLNWPSFPDRQICVIEDKLICNDGWQIVIFDLVEPLKPKLVFYETFKEKEEGDREEDIGAISYSQGIIYAAKKSGIFVYKLTEDKNGNLASEMIGHRRATPIERLAGRELPRRLILGNDTLVEAANNFGVLVYDVSDPTRPRRAYHGETTTHTTDIGIWNKLLYMVNYSSQLVFLDIPKAK